MAGGDRRCPQCGAKNDAERARCRICASPLDVTAGASAFEPTPVNDPVPEQFVSFDMPRPPVPPPQPPTSVPPSPTSMAPAARPRRGPALVAVIAVLVVALGVGAYLGPGRSYFDDEATSSSGSIQRNPPGAVKFSETAESIGGWVTFTDPDGYFSADFPSTPVAEQLPHPEPDRPPYTIWGADNVGVARLFLDATFHPDLQAVAETLAKGTGGTPRSVVLSQDPAGHPAADYAIDFGDGGMLYQYVVLADGEFFVLTAAQPVGTSDGLADLLKLKANFRILR